MHVLQLSGLGALSQAPLWFRGCVRSTECLAALNFVKNLPSKKRMMAKMQVRMKVPNWGEQMKTLRFVARRQAFCGSWAVTGKRNPVQHWALNILSSQCLENVVFFHSPRLGTMHLFHAPVGNHGPSILASFKRTGCWVAWVLYC
jgi:hypothetical protein